MSGDQVKKLLDRGCMVVVFKNELGTYTAAVVDGVAENEIRDQVEQVDDFALTLTDDFEPTKALHRLSEKMLKTGEYANWPNSK